MKIFLPKKNSDTSSSKGFTLVELLVVIVIIAILASVSFAVFSGIQNRARNDRRRADIDAIAKALEVNKTNAGYTALAGSQFSGGNMPTLDPQGYPYCGNTTVNTQPADPAAAWTTTCPANYGQISATIPVPVAGAQTWKVCTYLEAEQGALAAAFCRANQQN